jgi:ketosteroid isomerase-like protein
MNMDAIRQVFPSSPTFNFQQTKAVEIELSNVQMTVDGNRATVTFLRYMRQTVAAGRPQESRVNVSFTMERTPSGWLIASWRPL